MIWKESGETVRQLLRMIWKISIIYELPPRRMNAGLAAVHFCIGVLLIITV